MRLPKFKWYHLVVLIIVVILLVALGAWVAPFVFLYFLFDRIFQLFERKPRISKEQIRQQERKAKLGDVEAWLTEASKNGSEIQRN